MAAEAVAELDFINARAVFHQTFNCVIPEIQTRVDAYTSGQLELIEARHPLLEENLRATGGAVVPVSFTLDDEKNAMVISGANAGGKTVVLKTTGLLALMALSGISVPARVGAFSVLRVSAGGHRRSSIAGRKSLDVYVTRRQHRANDRTVRGAGVGPAR